MGRQGIPFDIDMNWNTKKKNEMKIKSKFRKEFKLEDEITLASMKLLSQVLLWSLFEALKID